jgi:ATP-binding cassette subfamily F protein 3
VALAKLALAGANFLVLDEPTNHLDIASQEVLQNVLADFEGTILLVSHDRYLIDALATQIWALSPGKLGVHEGTYREYLAAREKQRQRGAETTTLATPKSVQNGGSKPAEKKHGLNPRQLKQRIDEIEGSIQSLEHQLQALVSDIETASARGDAAWVRELGEAYTQTESALHAAMEEWTRMVE